MKLFARVLAGAILFAGMGAASAQQQSVNAYVRAMVEDFADPAEILVDDIQLEELKVGQSTEWVFEIDPDTTYYVYGACDDDCSDIDLYAHDADEAEVDADEEDDATPIMIILPGESGDELHVVAQLVDCATETCVVGVGVYAEAQ